MQQTDKALDDELVMNLVDLALAQPPGEREAYLRGACDGNTGLFDQAWRYVEWEQRMGGFLVDPLYTLDLFDVAFEPGQLLLDGRFRIESKIGEGGMGIVYRAVDEKLGRTIALKCAKAGYRKRLPPEVRHATEISHPNVCKIHDVHTANTDRGEVDFLTMEYLEGETLTERLRSGPLPEREARAIARQLAAGLAAAHHSHVIHGDLKSTNVILTKDADGNPRAVITDFGLASGTGPLPVATSAGVSGGTPDYMAPELWKGQKASVASDIYALGVIFYEMLTGTRLPEPGVSWAERLKRKPPHVHSRWDGILARCLDPDPARRYASVDEIAKALAPPSRLWIWATAAALVLAAATGLVTYRSSLTPPETVRLALLPFETSTADKALSDGLLDQTADRLRRVRNTSTRRLAVIPLDAAVQNKLDRPEKAVKLLSATHVLHGTLRRDGGRMLIHAYLTDGHSPVPLKDWQASYQQNELRDVPVALAGLVTGTLHLPALAIAATVNAAAYADFTKALGLLERNNADAAIPLFETAVKADPGSPLTHARLAEAQILKYWATNDQTWMERSIVSLGDAKQRNPDVAEVWSVSGLVNYHRGLYEAAEADLRRALEIEPQNGDAWRRLGLVFQKSNRFGQAMDSYQKALQVQPAYFLNYQDKCNLLNAEAHYQEAIQQCTQMVALAPDLSESYFARATPYFFSGHYPEAGADLRTALQLDPNSSKVIQFLAVTLAYQGSYQEAIALYQRAIAIGPETDRLYLNFGQTLLWAGDQDKARDAYRKAIVLAEANLAKNSRDALTRSLLGFLHARLGERSQAQSQAVLALQPALTSAAARWVMMTYEVLGDRERALAIAEVAPEDALRLLNSPDMADFRSDPRFQQLIRSRNIK